MAEAKDSKRFTLARKEKQNADVIRKQNLARIFLTSTLNEEIEQDDMSIALQDGVLLCKMINYYKPDSIKKFNANPRTPFKMMENASFVVDFGKKNQLGVNFTADDITNKEHLILILTFILNIAEKMAWTPPLLADITTSPPLSHSPTPASSSPTPQDVPHTHLPVSPLSNSPTNVPPINNNGRNTPNKGTQSIKSVLTELISSERDFIADMELFFRVYVAPAKAILPQEKTNSIFGNIENVVGANNKFIMELQMVLDGYMSISTVWKNFASAINIYSVYCIFQQNSYGLIEQCRREIPAFESHLRSVEYTPESKNVNIFNFLVKPFSRVVKYNSVLKQLLQIVSPGTEDFDILGECKKEFQDLSDTTSDTWKKVENSRKISEIAGTLVGAEKAGLRKLGRIYLREGDFTLNGKSVKLFLFSDIIVHAVPVKALLKKTGGKSHIFKGIIALNACTLHDVADSKEGKNVIELVGTGEQKYKIVASSPSDKRLWVTDISKSIARLQGHPPREQPANPSPLEPRPMLGGVGRSPPARLTSQTQMIVEERRKTVKLAFGGSSENDDEDDEISEEQLEVREASIPISEDDKRKTIKLEFAGIRQLSNRDRSKTVDLSFNKEEDGSDENNEEEEEEDLLIVDKRKTVKLDFKIPRPSDSPSSSPSLSVGSDDPQEEEERRRDDEERQQEERETHESSSGNENEGEAESESVEENEKVQEEQREENVDKEILSTDLRRTDNNDETEESINNHHDEKVEVHENNEKNQPLETPQHKEEEVKVEEKEEKEEKEDNHANHESQENEKNEKEEKEDVVHLPVAAIEKQKAHQQQEREDEKEEEREEEERNKAEPYSNGTHHVALSNSQPEPAVPSAAQSQQHTEHHKHNEDSDESENIIATLIGEITGLKTELKETKEKLDQTTKDLEKEKEDTKVWKTRVERILSVLLDAMKQKESK